MRFRLMAVLMAIVLATGFLPVAADDCVCPKVEQTVVKVCVDNTRTLAQLIAQGKYDWVHPDIAKNFTIESGMGAVSIDIVLFHFDKKMTTEQVLAEMDRLGLRPIILRELLSLGAQRPVLQREFPIVALGQMQQVLGGRRVAFLDRFGSERSLHMDWADGYWSDLCRFAAVRK
jgi:hypothetical protein